MKRSIDKLIFAILVAVCFCLQACTEYETPAEIAVDKKKRLFHHLISKGKYYG